MPVASLPQDELPVALFTFDDQSLIVDVNLAGAALLGKDRDLLLNQSITSYLSAQSSEIFTQQRRRALETGKPQSCDLEIFRQDGAQFYVQTQTAALKPDPESPFGERAQLGQAQLWSAAMMDVTRYKQAELALRAGESLYSNLFIQSQDVIFIGNDSGHIVDVNPTACRMLGYEYEELLQMSAQELTPEVNREQFLALQQKFMVSGQRAGECALICKDGTWLFFDYQVIANILPGRHLSILRDMTAHKQTVEQLKLSEERFRGIYEESPIAILLYSPSAQLMDANRAALQIFGVYQLSDIYGLSLFDNPRVPSDARQELIEGKIIRFQSQIDFDKIRQDGFYVPLRSGIAVIDWVISPLKQSGYLVQIHDITKHTEENLAKNRPKTALDEQQP